MKKLFLLLAVACVGVFSGATVASAQTQLLTNGSFESGFTGWTTTQPASPLTPWTNATSSNSGYFRPASPQDGTRDALNGFDGSAGAYTLTQQVTIPAGAIAALAWKDRIMYAMSFGAQARTVQVRILSTSNTLLGTPYSFSTGPGDGTCCSVPPGHDEGWKSHSVNLSAYAGQTVRVQFHFNIPGNFTGPGQAEVDAVSLVATNPDSDGDGVNDATDNCPTVANAGQANNDGDGQGDACDADDDNDGVNDGSDNCPVNSNAGQANNDGASQGDVCDADDDNDGVNDDAPDNCQFVANPDQTDADNDGKGAACDTQELPLTKDDCTKDGWRNYNGTAAFKNQGDCVSYVATGGKNQPAGS